MTNQAFKQTLAAIGAFLVLCSMATAEPLRIVAYGDSLVAGYGLPPEEAFPTQLEQALQANGHDVEVINAGVSGDTTAGGLARLDWSLADGGDLYIVALGANDGLRGLPPEQAEENLDKIVARLKQEGIDVLLVGMPMPSNMGEAYLQRAREAYEAIAAKHDVPLHPNLLEGVWGVAELNQRDYLHPNAEGVKVVVENLLPAVTSMLPPPDDGEAMQ